MDTSKRGYKLIQLTKSSTVLQDVTTTVDQHPELDNSNHDVMEDSRNYDLLEECRLTEELFNNENILFDSSIEISTSFVNKILEGDNSLVTNNIDRNVDNLNVDVESLTRIDNNKDEIKNVLKTGQLDTTAKENIGNINEEDLEKAEDCDSSFEVEQEEENDSTDVDGEVSEQEHQLEEREQENISVDGDLDNEDVSRKRKKRKFSNSQEWKYNAIKRKREYGLDYTGRRGKEFKIKKPMKTLKDRCKCTKTNTKIKCFKINEDRQKIFKKFWKLKWTEKRIYVSSRVLSLPTARARNRKENDSSQRSVSYQYFLNKRNDQVRVCKTMFCNTLGVSVRTISSWIEIDTKSPNTSNDGSLTENQGNNLPLKKSLRFDKEKENLKAFFNTLPKLESHYCRKTTSKLYIEPHFRSKAELYHLYKDNWCVEKEVNALSIKTFHEVFEELNLALYSPKKDECDVCVGYRTKNIEEQVYIEHVEKKNEARKEKETDKLSNHKVFTIDLQSVLLCPKSNASALYYRTKLVVHNYTIFDLHTKEGYCFVWHEGEGELTSNCFSSIICQFLISEIIPKLTSNQKIILFSDGCSAQNRNSTLSNALLNLCVTEQVCIEQKYLEKGHTQMECDSMHSTIERSLKGRNVNVPADIVAACKNARKSPKPYNVNYINHKHFKNFEEIKLVKSIRPGCKVGDPTVTDIRALRYNLNGKIEYKIRHTHDFKELPVRQSRNLVYVPCHSLPALYRDSLKIKKEKFENLMFLKKTMEADYHLFYDNLKHE